jgi:hypothetical protein
MLYIVRKTPSGKEGRGWHVNEPSPFYEIECEVCEVEADGHELDYIRRHCKGLPDCPDKYTVVWKSVLAQFIYDNALQNPKKYEY